VWSVTVRRLLVCRVDADGWARIRRAAAPLCALLLASALAACGAASSAAVSQATPPASPTISPTRAPTLTPTATSQPSPPLSTTAILDVRPSSMSLVGHLDCTKGAAYTCAAKVLARSSNQGSLRWSASTTVPGQIVFSPSSGVLAPGQSALVTITTPLDACTHGLFFFRGPANTHTISWAC
jgi:hypothetical protein